MKIQKDASSIIIEYDRDDSLHNSGTTRISISRNHYDFRYAIQIDHNQEGEEINSVCVAIDVFTLKELVHLLKEFTDAKLADYAHAIAKRNEEELEQIRRRGR